MAAWQLKFANIGMMFQLVVLPAIICSAYWLVRRKKIKLACEQVAVILFMASLINVLNDFSILLGLLLA